MSNVTNIVGMAFAGCLGLLAGVTGMSALISTATCASEPNEHPEAPPLNEMYLKDNMSTIDKCIDGINWQIFYVVNTQLSRTSITHFEAHQVGTCDPENE